MTEAPASVGVNTEAGAGTSGDEDLRQVLDATLDRLAAQHEVMAPVPANDTADHDTIRRRARAVRDAAEQAERRALEAFREARETRRQAQADFDEVQATTEVRAAPVVAAADVDLRLQALTDDDYAQAARIGVLEYVNGDGCEVIERTVEVALRRQVDSILVRRAARHAGHPSQYGHDACVVCAAHQIVDVPHPYAGRPDGAAPWRR